MKHLTEYDKYSTINEEIGKKDILALLMSLAFLKPVQAQQVAKDIEKKDPKTKETILRKIPDAKSIKDINNIVYKDTVSTIKREKINEPAGYHPLSLEQRKAWNEYLYYLGDLGLAGDPSLDEGEKGMQELKKYLKANPSNPLNEFEKPIDLVKSVQYEMMLIRKGDGGFPDLSDEDLFIMQEYLYRTRKPFMELMPSEIDGKPGQLTTKLHYPGITFGGRLTLDSFKYDKQIEDMAYHLIDAHGIKFINDIDLTNKLTPKTKQYLGQSLYRSR